jgi:NAD(P)H-hydrate epimerase
LLPLVEAPVVLDADGINAFAGEAGQLAECASTLTITPHPGELARLVDLAVDEIQADRVGIARECATELGCTVILKGAGTVTAGGDGNVWINTTGNSGMASGGMGDVLSGIAGALTASTDPLCAAYASAWIHGMAGDLAAEQIGPRGIVATDLLPRIPQVFSQLSR